MQRKTISERLQIKIAGDFGIPVERVTRPTRCYPGRHQRASGHWVWHAFVGCAGQVGSSYSMLKCVQAAGLVIDRDGAYQVW